MIEQGGLQPGGLNFDAKVRRESTDLEDLFIAHVGAMDAFARGLRNAVRIIEEGVITSMVKVMRHHFHSFTYSLNHWDGQGTKTIYKCIYSFVHALNLIFPGMLALQGDKM